MDEKDASEQKDTQTHRFTLTLRLISTELLCSSAPQLRSETALRENLLLLDAEIQYASATGLAS